MRRLTLCLRTAELCSRKNGRHWSAVSVSAEDLEKKHQKPVSLLLHLNSVAEMKGRELENSRHISLACLLPHSPIPFTYTDWTPGKG